MSTNDNAHLAVSPGEQPAGNERRFTSLTIEGLSEAGFEGFVTFAELEARVSPAPPECGGVYVVIRDHGAEPMFLAESCGGHFKGRNPTEATEVLVDKWVPGADVLYVGKAEFLPRRLREYARFGAGGPIGHWGGRYIWQLADRDRLRVAWLPCEPDETALELEAAVITCFKELYGCLPFANIADPTRRAASRQNEVRR